MKPFQKSTSYLSQKRTSKVIISKCLFFAALLLLATSESNSQSSLTTMQDSLGLHAYSTLKGDTLVIGYDSAFVLNKRIYALYKSTYQRIQLKDPSMAKLMGQYETLIGLQDSMLKEKETYYQGLKTNFDALSSTASVFADRTDGNVRAINSSLTNVNSEITNIKMLLDESLEKLRKQNGQKAKVAIGGFTLGVGIASLIFLLTK